MPTLELECPDCATLLELDADFAGGVCRCSSCGALMTVPADPSVQQAQQVTRPEQPDALMQRYVTRSGQGVELPRDASIPTAARRRRPVVRAVTGGLIIGLLACVLGIVIFALSLVAQPDPPATSAQPRQTVAAPSEIGRDGAVQQFGYDPDENPFTLAHRNVLGLALASRTVIVVDASSTSATWLPLVKEAVAMGLTQPGEDAQVGLIYATEAGPVALHEQWVQASALDQLELDEFAESIAAAGAAPLDDALQAALDYEPERIVLITGQRLRPDQMQQLAEVLEWGQGVRVDLIAVQADSPGLEDLIQQQGGQVVRLSENQLIRWYRSR